MADLQALQRENAKLQKSFKELELTVQQIESQKLSFGSNGVGPPQWNSNSQSHITNVKYLKDSFLKIKRAAVIDGKTIRAQEIAIDQEKQLRQTIRKELVAIKGRIKKYIEHNNQNKGNNNNSNANENKEAIEQLAYFRKTCRERLLLVRSEINAMAANQEAAFVSKKEAKNVRVTYWNGRGLAEPTRLMLSAGNIKFTDRFMSKASDLEAVRKEHNLFYQQLPLVEIDNMELVQSGAQMRYIARRCGMYGDSDSERYMIDVIYEGTKDARGPLARYWSRGVGMKETKEAMNEERYFGAWERQLESSKNGFFVSRPSMADVAVFEVLDYYQETFGKDAYNKTIKSYPNLQKLYQNVYKIGLISNYIENQRNFSTRKEYFDDVNATLGRKLDLVA